jgi:hypothetical protein
MPIIINSNREDIAISPLGIINMRKIERSNVEFPLWRKKVDSSFFHYKGTTLPNWSCHIWGIDSDFDTCISKKESKSEVTIFFNNSKHSVWVTCAKQK